MDLVSVIIVIAVLAVVWFLLDRYIFPLLPPPAKTVIVVVIVLVLCIWLLEWAGLTHLNIGHH